jgi:hypothetical protein
VRQVGTANGGDEEDDEEGWEEMAKKKREKKSLWRSKKGDDNGLKEMLGFAHAQ